MALVIVLPGVLEARAGAAEPTLVPEVAETPLLLALLKEIMVAMVPQVLAGAAEAAEQAKVEQTRLETLAEKAAMERSPQLQEFQLSAPAGAAGDQYLLQQQAGEQGAEALLQRQAQTEP